MCNDVVNSNDEKKIFFDVFVAQRLNFNKFFIYLTIKFFNHFNDFDNSMIKRAY